MYSESYTPACTCITVLKAGCEANERFEPLPWLQGYEGQGLNMEGLLAQTVDRSKTNLNN